MNTDGIMFRIVKRVDITKDKWNAFVHGHYRGWWWHTWEWIEYCLAYRGGKDLSFAVIDGAGSIVGLVPLIVERGRFLMGGNPTPFPLWAMDSPYLEDVMRGTLIQIRWRANGEGVADGEFMMLPGPTDGQKPMEFGGDVESVPFQSRAINLENLVSRDVLGCVRKSYRQLIRQGYEAYLLPSVPLFGSYADLHRSKYETPRSDQTYAMQADWYRGGNGMLVLAYDPRTDEAVGCAYWIIYKGRAYYMSGVYTRDNVAHVVIWESLLRLKQACVKVAEMGWHGRPGETEKEKNIAFFKSGFGGEDWGVEAIRWVLCTPVLCEQGEVRA